MPVPSRTTILLLCAVTIGTAGCGDDARGSASSTTGADSAETVVDFYDFGAARVGEVAYRDEQSARAGAASGAAKDVRVVSADPELLPATISRTGKLDPDVGVFHLLEGGPALSIGSDEVVDVSTTDGPPDGAPPGAAPAADGSHGGSSVTIRLDAASAKALQSLTRDAARSEGSEGLGVLLVVVDDRIVSAPVIDANAYPDGLEGGAFQLTGLSEAEARSLVDRLSDQ